MRAEIVEDLAALEAIAPMWDQLAIANALPMAAPAWMLGWWRHLGPNGGELRVVVVHDGDDVVGIAPYWCSPRSSRIDYRLLGAANVSRLGLLAAPGREWEVGSMISGALAKARPRPDLVAFESISVLSPWPTLIRESWPGILRPTAFRPWLIDAPVVSLSTESFDAWMASRSSNFRSQMRRMRRQLEREGGQVRPSTAMTVRGDLEALLQLHESRWDGRGGSGLAGQEEGLIKLYSDMAASQLASGRLRLQVVEVEGQIVSAQLFMAAGECVIYWNGGWNEAFAHLKPGMLGLLSAIEDAIARGERRLDLGVGAQAYKMRFASSVEPLAWGEIIAPGIRQPLTRLQMAPRQAKSGARGLARRGLTQEQAARVRSLRTRFSGLWGR